MRGRGVRAEKTASNGNGGAAGARDGDIIVNNTSDDARVPNLVNTNVNRGTNDDGNTVTSKLQHSDPSAATVAVGVGDLGETEDSRAAADNNVAAHSASSTVASSDSM